MCGGVCVCDRARLRKYPIRAEHTHEAVDQDALDREAVRFGCNDFYLLYGARKNGSELSFYGREDGRCAEDRYELVGAGRCGDYAACFRVDDVEVFSV